LVCLVVQLLLVLWLEILCNSIIVPNAIHRPFDRFVESRRLVDSIGETVLQPNFDSIVGLGAINHSIIDRKTSKML
jgi:hypothetical protein